MARTKKLEHLICNADDLGALLGIGRDMVLKHARENGMPKIEDGRYPVSDCVKWYVERIRARASESHGERERLVRAQRQRAELEIAQRRGELVERGKYVGDLLSVASAFSKLDSQAARMGAIIGLDGTATQRLAELLREFRSGAARELIEGADAIRRSADSGAAAEAGRGAVGGRKPRATRRRTGARALAD